MVAILPRFLFCRWAVCLLWFVPLSVSAQKRGTGSTPDSSLVCFGGRVGFVGGATALSRYLAAQTNAIGLVGPSGTVYVRVELSAQGEVERATVMKGVRPAMDSAALAITRGLPRFWVDSAASYPRDFSLTVPVRFAKRAANSSTLFTTANKDAELHILRDFALPNKNNWPVTAYPTKEMSGSGDFALSVTISGRPELQDTLWIPTFDSTLVPSFHSSAHHSVDAQGEKLPGWGGMWSSTWCGGSQSARLTAGDSTTFYIPYAFHQQHTYFRSSERGFLRVFGFMHKVAEEFTADSILLSVNYLATGGGAFVSLPFFIATDPTTGRHTFAPCTEARYRRLVPNAR